MVQAIANLRNAVTVLGKHQGASMMQLKGSMVSGMRVLLRAASLRYEVLVAGRAESRGSPQPAALLSLTTVRRRMTTTTGEGVVSAALLSAMDAHGAPVSDNFPLKFAEQLVANAANSARGARSFLQMAQSAPASGGIYGVMTQMLDEFQAELKTSREEEQKAQSDFKSLTATKTEEIETGKTKLEEMQSQAAGNSKALSDAKEDLAATRKQRAADVKFLKNLKVTCDNLDAEWEKRSKTRTAEMKAVSQAITVLNDDDSVRQTFHRGLFFLQEHSQRSGAGAAAAAVLRNAAQAADFETDDLLNAWHGRQGLGGGASFSFASESSRAFTAGRSAQLSRLAMAVQSDSLGKVKQMMDTMVSELKKQQADEVDQKDHCQNEIRTTEEQVVNKEDQKKDLETKIAKLESIIGRSDEEIAKAQKQLKETEVEIKKAGKTREAENKDFQDVVTQQRAAQPVLKKALAKLKRFYEHGIKQTSLVQRSSQTPPVKFGNYEANGKSNSVMGMLEQIIEDSERLEKEATEAETKAQHDYETFVKDAVDVKETLEETISTKTKAISSSKSDIAESGEDLEATTGELESLTQLKADLHNECDWLLKNFEIRQKARLHEIESIQEAKGILSGA